MAEYQSTITMDYSFLINNKPVSIGSGPSYTITYYIYDGYTVTLYPTINHNIKFNTSLYFDINIVNTTADTLKSVGIKLDPKAGSILNYISGSLINKETHEIYLIDDLVTNYALLGDIPSNTSLPVSFSLKIPVNMNGIYIKSPILFSIISKNIITNKDINESDISKNYIEEALLHYDDVITSNSITINLENVGTIDPCDFSFVYDSPMGYNVNFVTGTLNNMEYSDFSYIQLRQRLIFFINNLPKSTPENNQTLTFLVK